MSSYRSSSYAPWKSSLTSPYKAGSSSAYSSRDDISSTPRYTSLATPSTYRPSFSGGTYRVKREPAPPPVTTYVSRYSSASSSSRADKEGSHDTSASDIRRYGGGRSNLGKYSREPSPAAIEITNRIKSRDPSPVSRSLRGKSRDPSPVIDTNCKIGYGGVNSYRMSTPRSSTSGYGSSRYSSASSMPDKSISYLSVSDFRARSISRAKEGPTRKSSDKELEEAPAPVEPLTSQAETEEEKEEEEEEENASESDSGQETFVSVSVVTRATSPTPPGSTTVQRTRRIDIAKTIEKTIQRSTKKKRMLEKEIQSDRLDDSTRYSRFGMSSRVSSYSPETRYTSSNLRYSASPLSTTSKSCSSESKKEDSCSSKSSSKSTAAAKSKLSPPKVVRISSRQSSVENLSNASKPPAPPKAESPTKSSSSSAAHSAVKWPNKDFRKSALNVGPTDRPRKSRTPSSGTDSDAVPQTAPEAVTNAQLSRSPSAGSVSSTGGTGKRNARESKIRQRCHAKPNSGGATPPLSRHTSSSNLVNSAHKSCTPSTSTSSAATTTSSSSGTESSGESRKINKKNAKKKTLNSHSRAAPSESAPKENCTGDRGGDLSPKRSAAAENSGTPQPPATADRPPQLHTVHTDSPQSQHSNSKSPLSPQEKASHRLQKLSSVSNFFAARQNDTNSEPIFIESSESSSDADAKQQISSSSLTEDFETNASAAKHATATITSNDPASTAESAAVSSSTTTSKRQYYTQTNPESSENISSGLNPPCTLRTDSTSKQSTASQVTTRSSSSILPQETAATEAPSPTQVTSEPQSLTGCTTSTPSGEQEDPSWWQDTSYQINTSSALDFNHKDEMRFKLRHIDSGETAWWLRNDEDDTLADDNLRTLNHEGDASEATDPEHSLNNTRSSNGVPNGKHNWWTQEAGDEQEPNNENNQNETNFCRSRSADPHKLTANGSWETRPTAKSRCSPEKQWWGDASAEDAKAHNSAHSVHSAHSAHSAHSGKQNGSIKLNICRVESGERPWWLEEEKEKANNSACVEATIKLPPKKKESGSSSSSKNSGESKHWWMSGPTKKQFNIQRVESGEKAWWQQEEEEAKKPPAPAINRYDSSEREWWPQDDCASKVAADAVQNGHYGMQALRIKESDDEEDDEQASENGDLEVQKINNYGGAEGAFGKRANLHAELSDSFNFAYAERPPPLGQCASPIGLEESQGRPNSKSPYDNIPMAKVQTNQQQQQQQQQQQHFYQQPPPQQQVPTQQLYYNNNYNSEKPTSRSKLYISRHQNIDELLGGSCRPLSPLFLDGSSSFSTLPSGRNMFLEEITPDQVRIHDSTAQMPVIQRMERDEWDNHASNNMPMYKPRKIDDAAIQVYKDGDYGGYLDLESSLAEQAEEIEGLNSSRKNSLVVRTQLSVRVAAIIEKLLSAEKSDLRRALFSLKQVFQEDKDLVHAFVALGGLNCLVRVGNGADQNYQNYILRALGQVMLYVDGMNGVMKHEPTMQWLYSLIASNYRSVVKTALKLLLVFVEYAETNCYVLVNAIHAIDKSQGTLPWSNIMRLLKDYDNADAELVIYATSLINKTLAGLNDQDSFYDESDLLEQQGMESVIQRYMSKQGTDLDLLDQLQLYEAVLKFEDGESDGIRLPNNSMRKTQRCRQGTDTAERRKSRRHSTGTSPAVINKVLPTPKRSTLAHSVLDEDSSGSANSTEYSSGIFQEKKSRENVGVTPGLRRRRERAERHKSFLKEQQEAVANGIFAALDKREEIGQIVTAIPATVKSGDSPPESLTLTNETIEPPIASNNNNHTSNINYPNINIANATNNNNAHNNNYNSNNNNNNTATTGNSNNLMSPTKQLLGSNTISIINNSFDRAHNNNNNNNSNSNKLQATPEFQSKKNLLMERNATVINGIMKNIQRGANDAENRLDLHASNNAYKKFESDENRLNNYYNLLSTPKNHNQTTQPQAPLPIVSSPKKAESGFDFSTVLESSTPPELSAEPVSPQAVKMLEATSPASPCLSPVKAPPSPVAVVEETLTKTSAFVVSTPKAPYIPPPPPLPPDLLGLRYVRPTQMPPPAQIPPPQASIKTDLEELELLPSETVNPDETEAESEDRKLLLQLQRDHTVKDLTQKLSNMPMSPTQDDRAQNRIVGDMTGLISKAKEGLAKSKSKGEMSRSSSVDQEIKKSEPKKSENELHWDELVRNITRPLNLCDLDFTDLNSDDEKDMLAPRGLGGGVPPPPPPFGGVPPPMMPPLHIVCPPPMNNGGSLIPPPMFNNGGFASLTNSLNSMNGSMNGDNTNTIKKNKKTVKLFWKEVREDMIPVVVGKTIWDELPPANVDTQKLEHLFESRAKDLMTKKQQELNKSKEVIVLDHKRSNAINIAMTKLPPPRAIKAAILKMDATVVTREGIDKLLNMLPTDEERSKIQEAQMANPELPLGSAEQFLLTLASIAELGARLKLWAFRLDFDNSEKEIAEPLMDLKQGIEILRNNRTFRCILSTLLSVGIFLNGAPVKGFQIEYLAKVPEVKDTVHKHSLLHHLCHMVMETCTETTDLYSEIGPITRSSKADFTDLAHNLNQLEAECKASWDRLKLIAKHDCPPQQKQKLVDFLADCAERIILLQIVHRRVINRYRKFLLWLGVPQHSVAESRPNDFCRILSEFALEYRTTRERVQQQIEKKANHRERNKTRGKLIIDIGKFKTKEDCADAELKELLGTPSADTADGTLTWRRRRAENLRSPITRQSEENFTDGDDEILESLVKTATKAPGTRTTPRERKRTRHADRKSLRRTLKNGLTEEEKQHVAALIKTY